LTAEASDDASDMQNFLLRLGAFKKLDFRRFQISLDTDAIRKLPNKQLSDLHNVTADWLHDLTNENLGDIPLDKVSLFPLMKAIGEAMVDFIVAKQNPPFVEDLVDGNGKELLVSHLGDIVRIKAQMSNSSWLDKHEE